MRRSFRPKVRRPGTPKHIRDTIQSASNHEFDALLRQPPEALSRCLSVAARCVISTRGRLARRAQADGAKAPNPAA